MSTELPMACTLTGPEASDRLARWKQLAADFLQGQEHVPGGVRLWYDAAAEPALHELARLEAECCGWAAWRVTPGHGKVQLEVTAPGEQEQLLREMFRPR